MCNPGFGKVPGIVCERSQGVSASTPLRTGIVGHSICCFPAEKLRGVVGEPGVFLITVQTLRGAWMCLPSFLLDGRVFIAWYKYNQKVPIKLCYYCSTKLEMFEVLASWLVHAAMNILWERKYLVSDSFYSAATHRLVTFQISPKSKSLPVHLSFTKIHPGPWMGGVSCSPVPPHPFWHLVVLVSLRRGVLAGCPLGSPLADLHLHFPPCLLCWMSSSHWRKWPNLSIPKSTRILEFKKL